MGRKVFTVTYLSALCSEISMLLHAGITIQNGIMMMLDDEKDEDGKKVLAGLLETLDGGEPLSAAMQNAGNFPPYMVNMIKLGETTGRLTETLKALAEHYERQERLSVSIKRATIYPGILLAMMVVVVLVLVVQVLPIFNDVFARMGVLMSPFARRLMQFGEWFMGASVVLAIIFAAILLAAFLIWLIPALRGKVTKFCKDKWGGSWVFGRIASFQFVSSMATAMSSGLTTTEALNLAVSINSDSKTLGKKYADCMSMLEKGTSLPDALRDAEILSARDCRMLHLGGESGMVDSTMTEIARRGDISVQDEIASIVSRIEPVLVVITSVIVGVILLSVMFPLMGIMTSLS